MFRHCHAALGFLALTPFVSLSAAAETSPAPAEASRPAEKTAAPAATSTPAPATPSAPPPSPTDPVKLDELVVNSKREAQLNSIDRKVYQVGQDVQSAAGSASDLLQNVPSISVDLDGQVSLRGSADVLILIDGRNSALMGANRAAVLEQMPADSIERIEVITNPSAKYKPDGTSGIINIVTRKKRGPGFAGSVSVNAGNSSRANTNVTLSFNPGRWSLFGSYAWRQDDRLRTTNDVRVERSSPSAAATPTNDRTTDSARPRSRIIRTAAEFKVDDQTTLGAEVNSNRRDLTRHATTRTTRTDASGNVIAESERRRFTPERETDLEFAANAHHEFEGDGHELNVELKTDRSSEVEDNHYVNVSAKPATPDEFENIRITAKVREDSATVEYLRPLGKVAKLEAGCVLESARNDQDFHAEDGAGANGPWMVDPTRSNRFRADLTVHAGYVTYGRTLGRFGVLGGARVEQSTVDSELVNTGTRVPNDYFRFYPSLHLSHALADLHELQLNYSHRIHRPDLDDLNPFPEYQDPTHLRAGNPKLKPEDIHSIEFGHQYKRGDSSFITTAYYRQLYNGLADITTYVDATTLLTTKTNLSTSRAYGVEFAANTSLAKWATLDLSTNTFFNKIDASNLGVSNQHSAVSWLAKAGLTLRPAKATLIQLNTNYTSSKLTAQGRRGASYVSSIGVRQQLLPNRLILTLSVSDLFNSLKETTQIDTPLLHETITRRRGARIIYLGCQYKFGRTAKAKDEALRFDEGL